MRKLALVIGMGLAAVSTVAAGEDQAKRVETKETKAARLSDMELDAITAGAFTQSFVVISNSGAAQVLVTQPHHEMFINPSPPIIQPPSTGRAIGLIFVFNGGRSPQTCINLPC